ncbi:pentalenene synthase/avermitilol synthase [Streptomyces sp. DvalAA-14]|uniref:terpene synthase family protein n=1 Tax=Streptomyces sp. DvalAA-14 TaxID=1839759 RepID=UPI00081B2990|nr:terpene synthase family protein [Streptomyces sp. DvalAA-14]MYS23210.1 terpene cyclase [Streptomyces sp. SID4948]SCE29484.1 pentalenene synthase/avermitilol synthase [Streptomyces sp. DvalAA-14]
MPQDIDFDLPPAAGISPDLDGARGRNLQWVRGTGLVGDDRSLAWFVSWDMPRLAALGFPYARGPALDLCADAMAFFFVFDDQFDGPLGREPARVARVCQQMIDIVHGATPPADADPCSRAFADIRARGTRGAHPAWTARTAHEWEYYFAAHAHEAIGRLRATPADMRSYLQVRRGVAGTDLPLSLGEQAAGINVPAAAFHSPQLRIMRQAAIDVTLICNDVYSLEKEEARGDMDNIVLVVEHARRCTRDEAVDAARQEVARRVRRFQELAGQVPAICARLDLSPRQQAAVASYTAVMTGWMSGYHAWQTETLRYRTAPQVRPASGPGYFDQVLRAQPEARGC